MRGTRIRLNLPAGVVSAIAAVALTACALPAAEIHSNGQGGGNWSSPATWHGGKVPQSLDTVVIAMKDTVVFDRVGVTKPQCAGLALDPEGVLTFKAQEGKTVLAIDGSIESYGIIKLDGTKLRDGSLELRIVSKPGIPNRITLLQNSGILAYGREGLPENSRNVIINGAIVDGTPGVIPTIVTASGAAMVDLQHVQLKNVQLSLYYLDNTGGKPNERLNLIDNQFYGQSNGVIVGCDTPAIRNNEFRKGTGTGDFYALHFNGTKLADISGNKFIGSYSHGLYLLNDTDSPIINNTFEGCQLGVYWHGATGIIKRDKFERCKSGMHLEAGTAIVEDVHIEGATTGITITNSVTHQLANCRIEKIVKGGFALLLSSAGVTLVNSNISPDQLKLETPPATGPFVQMMDYVIIKVTGNVPQGANVVMQTAAVSGGVPTGGKADLNVRNSPARLDTHHETPKPASARCLTVRSWSIGLNKQRVNAPFYDVMLVVESDKPGQPPKVLAKQMVEPALTWFQINPAAPQPTLEVKAP